MALASPLFASKSTAGPGLVGALLVGTSSAAGLALALDKPLFGVNHLAAHISVDYLTHDRAIEPTIALLVSGGHSSILQINDITSSVTSLGSTMDDAAGEAFDKIARVMGLGFPGGPAVTATASISLNETFALLSARSRAGIIASKCARLAISGTTPPKRACSSTLEAISLASKVRPLTIPIAVSSQYITYREAMPLDLPVLVSIERTLFADSPWSMGQFKEEFSGIPKTRYFIVALDSKKQIVVTLLKAQ